MRAWINVEIDNTVRGFFIFYVRQRFQNKVLNLKIITEDSAFEANANANTSIKYHHYLFWEKHTIDSVKNFIHYIQMLQEVSVYLLVISLV